MYCADILILILQNLPIQNIVECSSINKLFYKAYNNLDIWKNKLTHEGKFTIPEQNYKKYKEIYQKYYCIQIQYNRSTKYNCIHKYVSFLKLPKIPSGIKYTTKHYDNNFDFQKMSIYCFINVQNCVGIKNIKLLLFAKQQITGAAINLISSMRISTEGLNISWRNVGLLVMEKMNAIKISEIFYEENGMWHYEIKIQFNAKEKWLSTPREKDSRFGVQFVNNPTLHDVHVDVKCILLEDEKIKSMIMDVPNNLLFYNYPMIFKQYSMTLNNSDTKKLLIKNLEIRFPLIGIFIYLRNFKNTCMRPFKFDSIMVTIGICNITMQQQELLQLEPNIYYIPMILEQIDEKDLVKHLCYCNNVVTRITLTIDSIDWGNNISVALYFTPLCYERHVYSWKNKISEIVKIPK